MKGRSMLFLHHLQPVQHSDPKWKRRVSFCRFSMFLLASPSIFFCLFCHIHTANIANTAQCAISQGVKYIVVSGGVCSSLGKALAFCGLIILFID